MASHQSVVNINIIMKFPIGLKGFVSLCTTLPYWCPVDLVLNKPPQEKKSVGVRSGDLAWDVYLMWTTNFPFV